LREVFVALMLAGRASPRGLHRGRPGEQLCPIVRPSALASRSRCRSARTPPVVRTPYTSTPDSGTLHDLAAARPRRSKTTVRLRLRRWPSGARDHRAGRLFEAADHPSVRRSRHPAQRDRRHECRPGRGQSRRPRATWRSPSQTGATRSCWSRRICVTRGSPTTSGWTVLLAWSASSPVPITERRGLCDVRRDGGGSEKPPARTARAARAPP